jgi:hypothetical protein
LIEEGVVPDSSELVLPDTVSSTIFVALANARMRGNPWKDLADEHLGDIEALLKRTKKSALETVRAYASATDKVDALDKKMLQLIEKFADAVWVARGSKHQDPLLSILTPGTPSFFLDWPTGHSGDRVEAVLEFVVGHVAAGGPEHDVIAEIQAFLPEYRATCDSARSLRAKVNVFEKMAETYARLGHVQYSRLRRRMQADGFEPTEIRNVFPDIPGRRGNSTFA